MEEPTPRRPSKNKKARRTGTMEKRATPRRPSKKASRTGTMEKEPTPRRPSKKARTTSVDSGGLTALALNLSNKFSNDEAHKDKNIMFSPLSMYTALGLVAAGARGTTLDQLLGVLGAASRDEVSEIVQAVAERALAAADDPSGPLVTSACGVWYQKDMSLKSAYRQIAVESYKAEARAVDFVRKTEDAREEINSWAAEATKNLITSVLPPGSVNGGTTLVLTNALYFKGEWEEAFRRNLTKENKFYRLDGSVVRVPFMAGSKSKYMVSCYDGFKVLKVPYKDGGGNAQYSMCVFLPNERDGLQSLAGQMAAGGSSFLFDHMPMWPESVAKLRLPKFKLSFFCSMKKVLMSLGLQAAFGMGADLSDMVEGSRGMMVEDVFHKAVIEVNEEGTEAAASTAVTMLFSRVINPPPPVDFVADHPFVFFIVEEVSGAVLFAGHVLDPSTNTE